LIEGRAIHVLCGGEFAEAGGAGRVRLSVVLEESGDLGGAGSVGLDRNAIPEASFAG